MNLPNWIAAPLAIGLFLGFVWLAKSGKLKEWTKGKKNQ